jgi:thiol:disulfide interchange protein DsbD
MVEYNGITHPIVSDSAGVFEKYHAYDGKHYLIASDGRIVATFSKLGISLPVLQKVLAKHGIDASSAVAGSKDPASMASGAASMASGASSMASGATSMASSAASAARTEARVPVAWKAAARPTTAAVGGAIAVTVSATVEPGWRIYATSQTGSGPEPLAVSIARGPVFAMTGPVKSPTPSVKFDPNFGVDVASHEDRADFELPVAVAQAAKPGSHTLVVEARYQTCNAVVCLPPQTEVLKIPLTVTARK